MPRRSRYDDEEERVPEGMTCVGYDADTGIYTYQDTEGAYWASPPGSRYGRLTRVGHESTGDDDNDDDNDDAQPFLPGSAGPAVSWRAELMPLLNFGLIIGVVFLLLFWYLHIAAASEEPKPLACPLGAAPYTIHKGDTCWAISESHGGSVDDLLKLNPSLNCDNLSLGSQICVQE